MPTGRKRNALVALLWHLTIAAAFALVEAAMWYFVPIKPLAKVIPSILVAAVIAIYALKGYMERRQRLGAFFILTGLLAAFVALQSLTLGDFAPWKALAIQIVYAGFMLAAYFLMWRARDRRKPEPSKAA